VDTSIAFLLLAAVLFAVIVPAILKRSAERNEERLPDRAQTVDVDRTPRCTTDASRPELLRGGLHPARIDLPVPAVETSRAAPRLSLRTEAPALEVVGGSDASHPDADQAPGLRAAVRDQAPPGREAEAAALPMAVGQSAPLDLTPDAASAVRSATGTADVLAFAPAEATAVASAGTSDSETMDLPMNSSHRPAPRRVAAAAERMPSALPADIRARLAQPSSGRSGSGSSSTPSADGSRPHTHHGAASGGVRRPAASVRPPMDAASRKRVRTLRAVLPLCGLALVGLALVTLVFLGFVVVGSMPWGVPVVTAALGLATLGLVRALNKEIRGLRRGRAAEAPSAPRAHPRETARAARPERPQSATAAGHTLARRTDSDADEPITADIPVVRETAAARTTAQTDPAADHSSTRTEQHSSARTEQSEPQQTSPQEAGPQQTRTQEANLQQDESGTDEWGESGQDEWDESGRDETPQAERQDADTDSASASQEDTDEQRTSRTRSVFAGSALPEAGAPTIAESLARERAPGEWTPTALPTPTYVDAPVAQREEPQPVVADASSYSLAPTDHESLAAQFAEELGYRPALADAARDESVRSAQSAPQSESATERATGSDGPLGHGRAAIRGSQGAASRDRTTASAEDRPSQLGDILARRRA